MGNDTKDTSDRRLDNIVVRILIVMEDFHEDRGLKDALSLMYAEIRFLSAWVDELGLEYVRIKEAVLSPVEDQLVARYGGELGRHLYESFRDAFAWRPWIVN